MAILLLEDSIICTDLGEITQELASLGVHVKHYDPGTSLLFPHLSSQDVLTATEKQEILELHDSVFEFLKQEMGYVWCDLQNLHPGSPTLEVLMKSYNRYHVHTAPESLYVLAGEAIFSFLGANGRQLQLLVQAQDHIHIPTGIEHSFSLSASLQLKAVRYFTTVEGWVPQYTEPERGTSVKRRF